MNKIEPYNEELDTYTTQTLYDYSASEFSSNGYMIKKRNNKENKQKAFNNRVKKRRKK